ncbi:MAG: nucleoside-triphosphatase [Halanaerobium sp.]
MNNFFLTGKKDAGKTTILKSLFTAADIVPGGYTTFRLLESKSGRPLLFQLKAAEFLLGGQQLVEEIEISADMKDLDDSANYLQINKNHVFAERLDPYAEFNVYPEVFDNCGANFLNSSSDIILIDELGRFELKAGRFKKEVFSLLESDKLVIGVIKAESNIFLDKIRAREDLKIFELKRDNRDKIYNKLLKVIRNYSKLI